MAQGQLLPLGLWCPQPALEIDCVWASSRILRNPFPRVTLLWGPRGPSLSVLKEVTEYTPAYSYVLYMDVIESPGPHPGTPQIWQRAGFAPFWPLGSKQGIGRGVLGGRLTSMLTT